MWHRAILLVSREKQGNHDKAAVYWRRREGSKHERGRGIGCQREKEKKNNFKRGKINYTLQTPLSTEKKKKKIEMQNSKTKQEGVSCAVGERCATVFLRRGGRGRGGRGDTGQAELVQLRRVWGVGWGRGMVEWGSMELVVMWAWGYS